jgi:hypothetical protein
MADMLPRPPASPGAPLPTTPASSAGPGIFQAFVEVLTKPAAFFESVRGQTGFGAPIVFALVMGLLSGVLSGIVQALGLGAMRAPGVGVGAAATVVGIVVSPIVAVVVGSFIGGAIVHLIALVAGGKGSFEQSVRIASYSLAVAPVGAVLGVVTFLPTLANLYALWIVAAGIIAIHLGDRKRTLLVMAVLGVVVILLSIAGVAVGHAAKNASEDLESRYGAGSDFQREIEKARSDMQRAAEEMQRAAEKARQQEPAP